MFYLIIYPCFKFLFDNIQEPQQEKNDISLQQAIYQSALEYQKSLKALTSLIIIDTAKNIKLRSVLNYEYLILIIKESPWLQSPMKDWYNHKVCIQDPTHIRDEQLILCKKKNNFHTQELFDGICDFLARNVRPQQLYLLMNFMIKFLQTSCKKRERGHLNQLQGWQATIQLKEEIVSQEQQLGTFTKEETKEQEAFNASLHIIKTFMKDDIFIGPLAITRKLSDEIFPGDKAVDYICNPLTIMARKDNNISNDFMEYKIGNLVMLDVDNMYVFNYIDVKDMGFPNDIEFDLAAIHDSNRKIAPLQKNGPKLSTKDYVNKKPETTNKTDPQNKRYHYQTAIQQFNGSDHMFMKFQVGNGVFNDVDYTIINEICQSSSFINHWRQQGIEICMGYRVEDKVKDILSLKEKNDHLEKMVEDLQIKLRQTKNRLNSLKPEGSQ